MGTVNQVEMDSSDEEPMEEQNGTQEDLDSSQGKFLRVEPPPKNFQFFWNLEPILTLKSKYG